MAPPPRSYRFHPPPSSRTDRSPFLCRMRSAPLVTETVVDRIRAIHRTSGIGVHRHSTGGGAKRPPPPMGAVNGDRRAAVSVAATCSTRAILRTSNGRTVTNSPLLSHISVLSILSAGSDHTPRTSADLGFSMPMKSALSQSLVPSRGFTVPRRDRAAEHPLSGTWPGHAGGRSCRAYLPVRDSPQAIRPNRRDVFARPEAMRRPLRRRCGCRAVTDQGSVDRRW
ncbi:hypothetical protein RHA1_ro03125 [Rhodococcus jostii RHA1]|uniref:Uncharacterized protein n=1 Tax=Rhodococcus jostii (strain RHA1) TaxID=101510 RepID=Q0SC08_RHOJR|nr:hypothetical protein RHA1_ro03125 [Rhodococcus jostii RHA1]